MLRAEVIALAPGDLIIFATDGVEQSFADDLRRDSRSVDDIAATLLKQFAKLTDDALVFVARVRGSG
jgi:hypothetical protein